MKRSVILTDRLGPDILLVLTMKRQVLHRERAHLKVPGCSLVLSALLTKRLLTFLSRLNEISGDCEKNDKDASKPVARHFNLPNHSKKHMAICGLSLHLGTTESRKNLKQKFILQNGTLNPHGINERFSFN